MVKEMSLKLRELSDSEIDAIITALEHFNCDLQCKCDVCPPDWDKETVAYFKALFPKLLEKIQRRMSTEDRPLGERKYCCVFPYAPFPYMTWQIVSIDWFTDCRYSPSDIEHVEDLEVGDVYRPGEDIVTEEDFQVIVRVE